VALAAALAAALLPPPARAGSPRGVPSAQAVAYVQKKCVGCHRVPAPGGRWAATSVSYHTRRMAISPRDWGFIREYFGEVGRDR
jgi:hypothetical protein